MILSNKAIRLVVLQAVLFVGGNLQTTTTSITDAFTPIAHQQKQLRNGHNNKSPSSLHAAARASGGRKSGQDDKISLSDEWEPTPCQPEEARLTVIQITDVYTLEHLASVKTLVEETRAKSTGSKVICMITGDFLSPYLLASVDRGQGMMNALNAIPMVRITVGVDENALRGNVVLMDSDRLFVIFVTLVCSPVPPQHATICNPSR